MLRHITTALDSKNGKSRDSETVIDIVDLSRGSKRARFFITASVRDNGQARLTVTSLGITEKSDTTKTIRGFFQDLDYVPSEKEIKQCES